MRVCMYLCGFVCSHLRMCAYTHTNTHSLTHMRVHTYVCMYVSSFVCTHFSPVWPDMAKVVKSAEKVPISGPRQVSLPAHTPCNHSAF